MDVATPTITSITTPAEGRELQRMIKVEVLAALQSRKLSRTRFSCNWNRGSRNRSLRRSSSWWQSPGKQQANLEDIYSYHQQFAQHLNVPATVHSGKWWGQSLVVTNAAGWRKGQLLYVTDCDSRLCFLVNTGAEVSIIPPSKAKQKNQQDTFGLLAANSWSILMYGTHLLTLNLGLHRTFQWVFIEAKVRNPLVRGWFPGTSWSGGRYGTQTTCWYQNTSFRSGVISSSLSLRPSILLKTAEQ